MPVTGTNAKPEVNIGREGMPIWVPETNYGPCTICKAPIYRLYVDSMSEFEYGCRYCEHWFTGQYGGNMVERIAWMEWHTTFPIDFLADREAERGQLNRANRVMHETGEFVRYFRCNLKLFRGINGLAVFADMLEESQANDYEKMHLVKLREYLTNFH